VRTSAVLLVLASLGMLLGGLLIGRWALGLCVIADSAGVAVFALLREDSSPAVPQVHDGSVASVLERARRAG
jgi:hypothetical protein